MRIGLARGNQLLVAPVHMQYVTGFSRTERSKEPAMNGTSGFPTGGGKLCRVRPSRKAQFEGQGQKFRKLSTQNPVLRTADRFLHEQQHRFGTGSWRLLHTQDLIALSTGFGTKRGKIADTLVRHITVKRESTPDAFPSSRDWVRIQNLHWQSCE